MILTGVPTEVIGVMPPSYAFPNPQVELWIPAQITRAMGYGLWDYSGVARVRHGATLADVRTELNSLINDLPNAYPKDVRAVGNVQTKLFFVGRWPPLDLVSSVRQTITTIDPNLALAQVRTLQDILDRASAQMAFTMVLLGIAASVALVLGMIGIYGVMSYIVSQRTGEIGVRLALGAEPARVSGAIVQQGAVVTSAGITIGVLIAFAGGRFIESLLYGVSPRDPAVFAATTLTLLVIALGACWLPARRAARLSPVEALRTD